MVKQIHAMDRVHFFTRDIIPCPGDDLAGRFGRARFYKLCCISAARVQLLQKPGCQLHKSIIGRGLIDTGATILTIDVSVVQSLGLRSDRHHRHFYEGRLQVQSSHMQPVRRYGLGIVMGPNQIHIASRTIPVIEYADCGTRAKGHWVTR